MRIQDIPGRAEEIRVRQQYRRLIMQGKLRLPSKAAVALVGPDCAYHIYRRLPVPRSDASPGDRP